MVRISPDSPKRDNREEPPDPLRKRYSGTRRNPISWREGGVIVASSVRSTDIDSDLRNTNFGYHGDNEDH